MSISSKTSLKQNSLTTVVNNIYEYYLEHKFEQELWTQLMKKSVNESCEQDWWTTRLSLKCSAWKSFIPCIKSLFPKEDPTFQIFLWNFVKIESVTAEKSLWWWWWGGGGVVETSFRVQLKSSWTIFLLSTNQRPVTLFVTTHTPQTTTHGQQYMLSRLHLFKKSVFSKPN